MDYEVFLVRRIQEVWRATGDTTHAVAVAVGLQHTALPITAAAAIMAAIFGAFVTSDVLEMKQIGFGLAVAVLIDATLVRIVLVPAVMRLAGASAGGSEGSCRFRLSRCRSWGAGRGKPGDSARPVRRPA